MLYPCKIIFTLAKCFILKYLLYLQSVNANYTKDIYNFREFKATF